MRFLQKLERKAKKKVNICKSDYIEHIFLFQKYNWNDLCS